MGTALGQTKKVNQIGIIARDIHASGLQFGPSFTELYDLPTTKDFQAVDADTVHVDFDAPTFPFGGHWNSDSRVALRAAAPKPATLLAAVVGIKPLTKSLYLDFSDGELPPATIKGVASVIDGEVLAVGGVSFIGGEYFIIFGAKPNANRRDIIKGWSALKNMLDENKTYYAIVDQDLETAPGLLRHFNFSYLLDDIYVYGG
jgi:hypothetical protein